MKTIDLFLNYRSRPEIISLANRLIAQSPQDYGRPQEAVRPSNPDAVQIGHFSTQKIAVQEVAREIGLNTAITPPGDVAILGRTHHVIRPFAEVLWSYDVPVATKTWSLDGDLWARPDAKRLLRVLRFIVNPHDMLSAMALYAGRLGPDGMERARSYRVAHEANWIQAIRQADSSLCAWYDEISGDNPKLIDCVRVIAERGGDELAGALNACAEEALGAWMADQKLDWYTATVSDLLDWVSAKQTEIASQDDVRDDAVNVQTVHQFKGLERPVVYVVGCTDTLFPHKRSHKDAEKIEEELRLMYVSFTRAMDRLVIVWWDEEEGYGGKPVVTQRSRFLEGVL